MCESTGVKYAGFPNLWLLHIPLALPWLRKRLMKPALRAIINTQKTVEPRRSDSGEARSMTITTTTETSGARGKCGQDKSKYEMFVSGNR